MLNQFSIPTGRVGCSSLHWTCLIILSCELVSNTVLLGTTKMWMNILHNLWPVSHPYFSGGIIHLYKKRVLFYVDIEFGDKNTEDKRQPLIHLSWNGPTTTATTVHIVESVTYTHACPNNSHANKWDWKSCYSCQGIGGAFLGYLPEEANRCRVRGCSCFKRLFENPWNGLIHVTKIMS